MIRGIDAQRDVILTDPEGQIVWRVKRFARPLYRAGMKRAGKEFARAHGRQAKATASHG